MTAHPSTSGRERPRPIVPGGALSLKWKLAFLTTTLLAAGLAAMLAFTYASLRSRAEVIIRDRLASAVEQVANGAEASLGQRTVQMRALAGDSAVGRVLRAHREGAQPRAADVAAARRALATLVSARDSLLPVELWDADGRIVAMAGEPMAAAERKPPALASLEGGRADSVRFGPLHASGDRVRFWSVTAVAVDGTRAGWIAQPRNIGPRDVNETLREFLSEDVTLYTYDTGARFWATPDGPAAEPVRRDSSEHGLTYVRPGTGRVVAAHAQVAGTSWVMVLESPMSWVVKRPRATVRVLALVGLVLTALGAGLAWMAGRRITRPLEALSAASEAVALGRYDRPVARPGRDEVGRLAASFDSMARQVAAARRELEGRVADAQHARAEAELANRAKGDFLAVMSHELRTPLNAIGGYAQLMEMGIHGPVTDAQKEALARIGRSQAHLLTLINDVLNFARIDAGQVRYAMGDVLLHEVLAEVEALVAPQVVASRLAFDFPPCDPELAVHADPDKLRQVLLNLLGNAIKYTPAGGTVALVARADEQGVRVEVRDTGTGIRAERLAHIFEPFVQGDRALNRPDEGVGLGLAISREMARGMGGELSVESEVGRGSTFTLTLQRAEPAPPLEAAAAAESHAS